MFESSYDFISIWLTCRDSFLVVRTDFLRAANDKGILANELDLEVLIDLLWLGFLPKLLGGKIDPVIKAYGNKSG